MIKKYKILLASIAIMIFYANLAQYFGIPHENHTPFYIALAFAVLCIPIIFSKNLLPEIFKSPIFYWSIYYLFISILGVLVSDLNNETLYELLRIRVLTLILFNLLFLIFEDYSKEWTKKAIVAVIIFSILLNIYDITHPLSFSPIYGRAAGLYKNPTICANALLLGMAVTITSIPEKFRFVFMLAVGFGICLTFSRAGIVGWLLCIPLFIWLKFIPGSKVFIGFTLLLLLLVNGIINFEPAIGKLADWGVLNTNVENRIRLFTSFKPSIYLEDESAQTRLYITKFSWKIFLDHPLLGAGLGADYSEDLGVASHNIYLAQLAEHGILGLFTIPLLVLSLCRKIIPEFRKETYAFCFAFCFMGLFSHNILEEWYVITLCAFISSMSKQRIKI